MQEAVQRFCRSLGLGCRSWPLALAELFHACALLEMWTHAWKEAQVEVALEDDRVDFVLCLATMGMPPGFLLLYLNGDQ